LLVLARAVLKEINMKLGELHRWPKRKPSNLEYRGRKKNSDKIATTRKERKQERGMGQRVRYFTREWGKKGEPQEISTEKVSSGRRSLISRIL